MQTYNFNEASLKDGILSVHTTNISSYPSHNYSVGYNNKTLIKVI